MVKLINTLAMSPGIASKDHKLNGREFKKADRVLLDVKSANLDVRVAACKIQKANPLYRKKSLQMLGASTQ